MTLYMDTYPLLLLSHVFHVTSILVIYAVININYFLYLTKMSG